MVSDWILH